MPDQQVAISVAFLKTSRALAEKLSGRGWRVGEMRITSSIRLSFRRDGSVFGMPMISFSKLIGSRADQQELRRAVSQGIAECSPFKLAPGFGAAIAGRPLTLGIVAGAKALSI